MDDPADIIFDKDVAIILSRIFRRHNNLRREICAESKYFTQHGTSRYFLQEEEVRCSLVSVPIESS